MACVLAGCNGGTVDRHALTNDAATIDSITCEAWLLSDAAARGHLTRQFVGEQAEELSIQAANFADALGRRPTSTGLETRVRRKAREAAALAQQLRRLQHRPTDRAQAAQLSTAFKRTGKCT